MLSAAAAARTSNRYLILGGVAMLATLCAEGCGGGGGPSGPPAVGSVQVALSKSALLVGETANATATVKDDGGNVLTGRATTWSSSNSDVASITQAGVLTGVGAGTATISATSEGHTGSATITVSQPPVATVTITLASPTVFVGATSQASATLRDINGNILTGRNVAWASDNTGIATVNSIGLITGVAAGTANISATSEGKTGAAAIAVNPPSVASVTVVLATQIIAPGSRTQATATAKDANGNTLAKPITFASDNQAVATITAQGVVTAVAAGQANITATAEAVTGSTAVTVATAAGFGSSSEKIHIVDIGATFKPALLGPSASAATFTSRATSVATIDTQGVITGVGAGQTWIAVTAPGFAPDSVYVIVPRNTTGPVLRTDFTNYLVTAGTSVTINVILDTRATPIGGSEFSVGYTTNPTVFSSAAAAPTGSPAPVISITQQGVFRVSVASATPLTGQLSLVKFTFNAPITQGAELLANRSGYLILNLLDIVDPTGVDLLPVSTSTRIPIIIQ